MTDAAAIRAHVAALRAASEGRPVVLIRDGHALPLEVLDRAALLCEAEERAAKAEPIGTRLHDLMIADRPCFQASVENGSALTSDTATGAREHLADRLHATAIALRRG